MTHSSWTPDDVRIDQPSIARIYDYNLGGAHNFAVDRDVAEQINRAMPDLPLINRANRAFLRRAVCALASAGIRQFLDLGSGIPTAGNVHEIAQRAEPESRVLYVDIDPVAVTHAQAILAGNGRAGAVQADLRHADRILADPRVTGLIDFGEPVAVLAIAVLHFVPDRDAPAAVMARYRDATVPGSCLVISHATQDGDSREEARAATEVSARNTIEVTLRGRGEVVALFDGFDLVPPGVVFTPQWRPDSDIGLFVEEPARSATLAGLGVRR